MLVGERKHRMKTSNLHILAPLVLAMVVAALACDSLVTRNSARSDASMAQANAATQVSEGGQVTVKVTWQGSDAGPVFLIAMDTHSVDLDRYDLRELATLRTEKGNESTPSAWDAPKGGHHREGRP